MSCLKLPVRSGRTLRAGAAAPGAALLALALLFGSSTAVWAQTTGRVMGRAIEKETRRPAAAAEVTIEGTNLRVLTSEQGNFILDAVPTGERRLRIERIGFRPAVLTLRVRAGRTTAVTVELVAAPVELEGIVAEIERVGLIEPEVIESQVVVLGGEIRALPVDNVEEVVELTTGVADGHFRGGRVGQETYKVDGLEVKNQLEASTQGPALELSPSSLDELEVITGGFGADNGSAISGVVSYVTRKGDAERWDGRAAFSTDAWAPEELYLGFTGFSGSIGGPIGFLGKGTTLFADLLAQGRSDSDPRARGLTCLRPEDGDEQLARAINSLAEDLPSRHLYCPFTAARLPHQRGDKLIGFVRLDRPFFTGSNLMLSFLYNRRQRELYTPQFKYNRDYQLGQRTEGYLGTLAFDWARHSESKAYRVITRLAAMRIDRFLGVVDPWTFDRRARIGGFGFADFRFLGEEFVRSPIEGQLESGGPVPGYVHPGGTTGTPFGPAAEGIFFTQGTPGIANWNRTDLLAVDLAGELVTTRGHRWLAGATARFYRIENYERVQAYLPGSLPSFARFYPSTLSGYIETNLRAAHDVTVRLGLRVEAFRSGLRFQEDRVDFLAPVIESGWEVKALPRMGMAVPVPGTSGRTMFRLNYGLVAQPPDFAFFLDSTIGDSLRTDIRRQGNPNLSFERGSAWELGVSQLLTERVVLNLTFFLKELTNLVTSSLSFTGFAANQFTTGDFGSVKGVELTGEARWPKWRLRGGYALQEAKGVSSSAFEDPGEGLTVRRLEFPLAFDRRHSFDLTFLYGRAARSADEKWGLTVTGSVRSGFPLNRMLDGRNFSTTGPQVEDRLPWTHTLNMRVSRELGRLFGCGGCGWRVFADARNVLGIDNVIALRRDTGTLAPTADELADVARQVPEDMPPIPQESPDYSASVDLDSDGKITAREMRVARFAAALDRNDPSLFFGPATQLRLGLEITF
jgi:hypothetical protein